MRSIVHVYIIGPLFIVTVAALLASARERSRVVTQRQLLYYTKVHSSNSI